MNDPSGIPGHSGRMALALKKGDPGPVVEQMASKDAKSLARKVDDKIRQAEFDMCTASMDPLPHIWGPQRIARAVQDPDDDPQHLLWAAFLTQIGGSGEG